MMNTDPGLLHYVMVFCIGLVVGASAGLIGAAFVFLMRLLEKRR